MARRKQSRVSESKRAAILKALQDGASQHATAKHFHVGKGTVNRLAKEHGLERSGPKKAAEARRDYAVAERIELLNEAFTRGRQLLASPFLTAQGFQQVMTGIAIGIDKRRLEDGQATERTDVHVIADATREHVLGELGRLASRNRETGVPQPAH